MTDSDPVAHLLTVLRARQDAEYSYKRAKWRCIEHGRPLPPEWEERRLELWKAYQRAVERDCQAWVNFKRRIRCKKINE